MRPAVAQGRLHLTADGQAVLQLRHAWSDGTTHLLFHPLELLERLAVLALRPFENLRVAVSLVERRQAQGHPEQGRGMIPRPRINLILYHGVLGPRAAWRSLVVRFGNPADPGEARTIDAPTAEESAAPRATEPEPGPPHVHDGQRLRPDARLWADLMRRSFSVGVLTCPRCGGRLRLIALIEEASVIERILRHLRLPTDVPTPRPGRAPPLLAASFFDEDLYVAAFTPHV